MEQTAADAEKKEAEVAVARMEQTAADAVKKEAEVAVARMEQAAADAETETVAATEVAEKEAAVIDKRSKEKLRKKKNKKKMQVKKMPVRKLQVENQRHISWDGVQVVLKREWGSLVAYILDSSCNVIFSMRGIPQVNSCNTKSFDTN